MAKRNFLLAAIMLAVVVLGACQKNLSTHTVKKEKVAIIKVAKGLFREKTPCREKYCP